MRALGALPQEDHSVDALQVVTAVVGEGVVPGSEDVLIGVVASVERRGIVHCNKTYSDISHISHRDDAFDSGI